jgi:hypothetical protein
VNNIIPERAKTGVGQNSNIRRADTGQNGGFIMPKMPTKKVADEIIL